ncbi:MAG TPA: T9SS type A sorting domain-containing protein, partial [Agriterribacter sp.]|nr:T9SS type A sorting domain-containing protein [Agriterribacter sp.]
DAELNVNSNILYYRIKVISKDGVSKYSNILTVRISQLNSSRIRISPNPASSSVNVSFFSALRGNIELQLMDMTGKVVLREQRTVESGQYSVVIDKLSRLSEGIYTILIRIGDRWERERIVIKR